jgi:phage repressor protein C with HTH and peptisase S24 domain
MKSVEELRRINLDKLIQETPDKTIEQVAEKAGCNATYLRQVKNQHIVTSNGKPATMGKIVARRLEAGFGKFTGWMDVDHDNSEDQTSNVIVDSFEKKQKGLLTIAQYDDVRGSMGVGVVLQDQPGQITLWEVTPEWIEKNIPANTGNKNLKIITGFGDSMKGLFNPGDPLVIDVGVKVCNHDGVFFFRVGNEGFVKTLQRIPGEGIRVISENKKYETWTIKPDMDFEVLGKVLILWKSDKLG